MFPKADAEVTIAQQQQLRVVPKVRSWGANLLERPFVQAAVAAAVASNVLLARFEEGGRLNPGGQPNLHSDALREMDLLVMVQPAPIVATPATFPKYAKNLKSIRFPAVQNRVAP